MMRDWISIFHERYLNPAESELSRVQNELFVVHWRDCREKLNPDIEGTMIKSILDSSKIMKNNIVNYNNHEEQKLVGQPRNINNADHDMRDEEVKGPRGDKFDEF